MTNICRCGSLIFPKNSKLILNSTDVDLLHQDDIYLSTGQIFQTIIKSNISINNLTYANLQLAIRRALASKGD